MSAIATVPIAVGATGSLCRECCGYAIALRGKGPAHRLWRCFDPPGTSPPLATGRRKPQFQRTTMKAPVGSPAESAGELYFKTDVSPEQIFQAIGRLRREARDEIDRLIRFLDDTEGHMEREPDDDEECGDDEPSLCGIHAGEQPALQDLEGDHFDDEPSLGSLSGIDQRTWAAGGRRDLERDPAESGIGDRDGLLEQVGTEDWRQGSMA